MTEEMLVISSIDQFLFLIGATVLGGFIRGSLAFGGTLVMVPLFSLAMGPAEAIFIGLILDVIVGLPLLPPLMSSVQWRQVTPILVGYLVFAPIGSWVLVQVDADLMRVAIAVVVVASGLLMLTGWSFGGKPTTSASLGVGGVSGFFGTAVGIAGPIIVMYFVAGRASARETRGSMFMLSSTSEAYSALAVFVGAAFAMNVLSTLLYLLPVMLVSSYVGSRAIIGISDRLFRIIVLWFVVLFGLFLVGRTAFEQGWLG